MQIHIRKAAVKDIPLSYASFDKIAAINTVYYRSDINSGLQELCRVLKPVGTPVLGIIKQKTMDKYLEEFSEQITFDFPEDFTL